MFLFLQFISMRLYTICRKVIWKYSRLNQVSNQCDVKRTKKRLEFLVVFDGKNFIRNKKEKCVRKM